MAKINELSALDSLQAADNIPCYSSKNGDPRRFSLTTLLAWLQANLAFITSQYAFVTQRSAPSATGFSVAITDGANDDSNIHLILTPMAGYAAGTLVLPLNASLVDKQEFLMNTTQQVTALTVDGNGATVTGAPATLAANAYFRLKYDALVNVWYRIG